MVHRQHFAERQKVRLKSPKRIFGLEFEHVIGELVVGAEVGARDGVKRGKIVLRRRLLALEVRVAVKVAEPVGVAVIAAEQRLQRIALQRSVVALLEQLEKPVVRARLRDCRSSSGQQRTAKDQSGGEVHINLGIGAS